MSHISANNTDSKLICVSLCLMSGPQNPHYYGKYIGLWGLWQPFSKWPMRIFNVLDLGEPTHRVAAYAALDGVESINPP